MVKTSLKPSGKFRRHIGALVIGVLVLLPTTATATYPVFDATSFTKLIEQFNSLQKQLDQLMKQTEILGKVSKAVQDQVDTIGKLGNITMPIVNMARLAQAINKDARCLLPDLSGLMPGLNLDELDWESICSRRRFYQEMLWFDPNDPDSWKFEDGTAPEDWSYPEGGSWGGDNAGDWKNPDGSPAAERAHRIARDLARKQVLQRQNVIVKDAINTGFSQSDQIIDQVEANQLTADEIEAEADAADTLKKLVAVLIKVMLHQDRQAVQSQQQRAQLIRIQAATLMKLMPPEATLDEALDGIEVSDGSEDDSAGDDE
ncbi:MULTISPECIES: hypothetical protein [Thalassospira]|jgi:hypothetical protein|uniref:Uncharacterized protein n=1 Tax=Thalassospira lohafexi TaxID=744227 RepID=A0A2N3L191_9PROT|nr:MULTISPECIES: hypothetical protein [Thalassospira]PKR56585.1 hypothetical protein COO92_20365 [Thalassospira lohafexi]|tara:strand:- start:25421 stop:26368 length:948 start_codon:yes stop_codon:yes gene_type:complete